MYASHATENSPERIEATGEDPHVDRAAVEVEKAEGHYAVRAPADQDKRDWTRGLQKALGSRSKAFVIALALIESLEPKNEIEAALAVDIACLHAACGNLLGRLADACHDRPTMAAANATAKLSLSNKDVSPAKARQHTGHSH